MKKYKFNTIKNTNKNLKNFQTHILYIYMVRLDTPANTLTANILVTFRLILKMMLIEFRTKF